jgi:L-aspartate oxidase
MPFRFDYVVIGSGLAGLTFALHAAEHGSVAVLTKAQLTDSSTSWAQGGIAAAVGDSDSWELHEQDTLIAGAGLCSEKAVRRLVQAAPEAVAWLRGLGAQFELDATDALVLGREGGHSRHRIVHHQDATGWEIERAVSQAARSHPNITFLEHAFVTRLLVNQGRCVGCVAEISDVGSRTFLARATLLATGGCGKVYAHTTNPRVATGDGIRLASEAGAKIEGMEFQQFHPTTLCHDQARGFLITEAVRGFGATLRTHLGRRFMYDHDPRLELAPRDVVSRAIEREIRRLDTWCVYLDPTHLDAKELEHKFPNIWSKLRSIGIQMERDWIPIVPAQHYSCGGATTNLEGQTSVPGLYAAGECASTGVHGANRLASNSLLEAIVFARAAANCCQSEPEVEDLKLDESEFSCPVESEAMRIRHALQRAMSAHCGIFRTDKGLEQAEQIIETLSTDLRRAPVGSFSPYAAETASLLATARLIVQGAKERKENVGLHYNQDREATSAAGEGRI